LVTQIGRKDKGLWGKIAREERVRVEINPNCAKKREVSNQSQCGRGKGTKFVSRFFGKSSWFEEKPKKGVSRRHNWCWCRVGWW